MLKNIINKIIIDEYKFKYLIFSVISGILLGLSFQKFNFYLLAWIAFIPLIYCIYKNNLKYSALYGFVTGIIYSLIAFNWMFLFEAYRYTTISNATISYYFAPIFVMILAPFILKEKMARFKVGSIIAAIIGIFFIVGIDNVLAGKKSKNAG